MRTYGFISISRLFNGDDGYSVFLSSESINVPVNNELVVMDSTAKRIKVTAMCGKSEVSVNLTANTSLTGITVVRDNTNKYINLTPTKNAKLPAKENTIKVTMVIDGTMTIEKDISVSAVLSSDLSMGGVNLVRDSASLYRHQLDGIRANVNKTDQPDETFLSGTIIDHALSSVSALSTQTAGFSYPTMFADTSYNGKVYTYSFWIKASKSMTLDRLGFLSGGTLTNVALTTAWKKVTHTWVYTSGSDNSFIAEAKGNVATNGTVISIADLKVESGYFATDWSPNPADTNDVIKEIRANTENVMGAYSSIYAILNGDKDNDPDGEGLIDIVNRNMTNLGALEQALNDYSAQNDQTIEAINVNVSKIEATANGLSTTVGSLKAPVEAASKWIADYSSMVQSTNQWMLDFVQNGITIGSLDFSPERGLTIKTSNPEDATDHLYSTTISSKELSCKMYDPKTGSFTKDVFALSEDYFVTKRLKVSNGIDLGTLKFVNTQDNGVQGIDVVPGGE